MRHFYFFDVCVLSLIASADTYDGRRSMTHNENEYLDPMRLMSERFLDVNRRLTVTFPSMARRWGADDTHDATHIHIQDLRGQVPGGCVRVDSHGVHLGSVQREQGQGRTWTRGGRGAPAYAGADHVRNMHCMQCSVIHSLTSIF